MAKIIAVFNQKGGVGKTTTTINLGACLAIMGRKILIIDMDPQGNTTSGLGVDKKTLELSIYDCLMEAEDIKGAVMRTEWERLHIIPSSADLAGAEVEWSAYPNGKGFCAGPWEISPAAMTMSS